MNGYITNFSGRSFYCLRRDEAPTPFREPGVAPWRLSRERWRLFLCSLFFSQQFPFRHHRRLPLLVEETALGRLNKELHVRKPAVPVFFLAFLVTKTMSKKVETTLRPMGFSRLSLLTKNRIPEFVTTQFVQEFQGVEVTILSCRACFCVH